jgi:hypothetical protein
MRITLAALAALAAISHAHPASAQFACMVGPDTDAILKTWLSRTGQTPLIEMQVPLGATSPTAPMLFSVAPDGAFSILMLTPEGSICIIAVGEGAQPSTGPGFPKPIVPGEDS